jgi:RNA-directed DNA polymerase
VYIPKAEGKSKRPLGIPSIRDRVAQTAAMLVLEPIFEADLPSEQYGYRKDRSALDAIRRVHQLVNTGHREIVDADLSSYFDEVPHLELLQSLRRRVADGAMLHLLKMWLETPVEEIDDRGHRRRSTRNRDEGKGTPQGSPISPLFSNLYMRRFVLGWKHLGYEERLGARIVSYADDFVICCGHGAEQALEAARQIMTKLKLRINEAKTQVCRLPEESFDFLGYRIGRCYSKKTGKAYLGTTPSKKRVQRICHEISEATQARFVQQDAQAVVKKINQKLIGWSNYFCLGPVSKAYRTVDKHTVDRLRRWLCIKHKLQAGRIARFSDEILYAQFGLARLAQRTASFPWAQA